eukprot:g73321.t1
MNGQGTEGHGSGGKATGATVFIGAGGGGDTVFATCCALVQSKSQTHRGPCIALGVGYGSSEYEKALGNGLKNRKTGEWDRLPCDKAKLREYLSKVVQPIQGAKGPLKDVWRVVGMSQEELMEFAKPLIPEGKDPGWSKNASFKYMTLMEETTFANQLAVRGEKQEICMVFSTAKSTDSEDYVHVGGDIIAPKVQRDSNVLRACIAIAEELKVRLVVEIFGAGCDAHAPYVLVEERLARGGYTPNADKVSTTELRDFLPFLKAEEHKLASEIMGEGVREDARARAPGHVDFGREEKLGATHPEACCCITRASWRRPSLCTAVLCKDRRRLGAEYPSTLTSVNNLGLLLEQQGKLAEAEPLYRRALQGQEKTLGAEQPGTLTSVNTLAGLLYQQGKLAEAEPLYRRALQGQEKTLGAEHPGTLISVNNLGVLLKQQGKLAQAARGQANEDRSRHFETREPSGQANFRPGRRKGR